MGNATKIAIEKTQEIINRKHSQNKSGRLKVYFQTASLLLKAYHESIAKLRERYVNNLRVTEPELIELAQQELEKIAQAAEQMGKEIEKHLPEKEAVDEAELGVIRVRLRILNSERTFEIKDRKEALKVVRKISNDILTYFKKEGVGAAVGRSGGHGTPYKKAGSELIRLANQVSGRNQESIKLIKSTLKSQGIQLINRGKSISHRGGGRGS